ncbi:uncharacterized protein LOC134664707 [Cydia fagiglandana]|uniref:uncharacterized protein LOC134664707 n=1 Tax=Cydia fagiglandana TaxID=1458189 RepID=UPI002FEE6357
MKVLHQQVKELQNQHEEDQRRIAELEARLEQADDQARDCAVEIRGVPVTENEDLYERVQQLGAAVGTTLVREDLSICRRTRVVNVAGYQLIHKRREGGRRGGGVGFYVRARLAVRPLALPTAAAGLEQLWLHLTVARHTCVIGTAYRPPQVPVDAALGSVADLWDRHAPVVSRRAGAAPRPWLTGTVRRAMLLRERAGARAAAQPRDSAAHCYYRQLRNQVTEMVRAEKQAAFTREINSHITNSKRMWNGVRKCIATKKASNEIPQFLNDPDKINSSFLKLPPTSPVPKHLLEHFALSDGASGGKFTFKDIDEKELLKIMGTIKTNAEGTDAISIDMLKLTMPRTIPVLLHIINTCLLEGCFPTGWKEAVVTPLPKKDQVNDYRDLRPISILPAMSKILEKAMTKQLSSYLEGSGVIPDNQSGFRAGRSPETTLLNVVDEIVHATDRGLVSILVLLDFSRAFDSLDIELLLCKLRYYGLDSVALRLMKNYLTGRKQMVKCLNKDGRPTYSSFAAVTRGCPQGACISPLLYAVYTAELPHAAQHAHCEMFADDTQLLLSFAPEDAAGAVRRLNEDLQRVWEWARDNALCLNPGKTNAIMFGARNSVRRVQSLGLPVRLGGTDIPFVDCARNLGLYMDSGLKFEKHINLKIKAAMYKLKSLYKINEFLSAEVRRMLVESVILSQFNYCDTVYGPCILQKTSHRIQKVQNSCARFSERLGRRDRITPALNQLNSLKMSARRRVHLACATFRVLARQTSRALADKLRRAAAADSARPRRALHALLLVPPEYRAAAFRGSFRYAATKCWNDIPPPVREAKSIQQFKSRLKKLYMNNQKEFENIHVTSPVRDAFIKLTFR